eukprot:scaffold596549_cov118-Attheya_sp.AAC.2
MSIPCSANSCSSPTPPKYWSPYTTSLGNVGGNPSFASRVGLTIFCMVSHSFSDSDVVGNEYVIRVIKIVRYASQACTWLRGHATNAFANVLAFFFKFLNSPVCDRSAAFMTPSVLVASVTHFLSISRSSMESLGFSTCTVFVGSSSFFVGYACPVGLNFQMIME